MQDTKRERTWSSANERHSAIDGPRHYGPEALSHDYLVEKKHQNKPKKCCRGWRCRDRTPVEG